MKDKSDQRKAIKCDCLDDDFPLRAWNVKTHWTGTNWSYKVCHAKIKEMTSYKGNHIARARVRCQELETKGQKKRLKNNW